MQRGNMKNNKRAYRIYMALSPECRKFYLMIMKQKKWIILKIRNGIIDSYGIFGIGYG